MRRRWIGAGWKMNMIAVEAEHYVSRLRNYLDQAETDLNVFIVPPFTLLQQVCARLAGSPIKVAAQNMHWESKGAFTGEISPLMLRDCGVQIVELGHFERRTQFAESDFTINRKVLAALDHALVPLICVGETHDDKVYGVGREAIGRQLKIALSHVPQDQINNVMIAYEPAWAIGEAGEPADHDYANRIHQIIREFVSEMSNGELSADVPILYGGSVNRDNARGFMEQEHIDGLFVGRAALDVESFIQLIQVVGT